MRKTNYKISTTFKCDYYEEDGKGSVVFGNEGGQIHMKEQGLKLRKGKDRFINKYSL